MAEDYAMNETALRHRRIDEDGWGYYNGLGNHFDAEKPRRRRRLTWPRIFLGVLVFVTTAVVYQFKLVHFPNLSPVPLSVEDQFTSGADVEKRDTVVEAFKHSWRAYERDAMGADEYHPLSHRGSNFSIHGSVGYMVIDAIDTMFIMGLNDEYKRARFWLSSEHSFDKNTNYNTFETTIRILGGLLSMFHLTKDQLYLSKAVDLADRMLPVFETPSGLPYSMANLGLRQAVDDPYQRGLISTAEATTLQLEWRYLTYVTGNSIYWDKAEKVMQMLRKSKQPFNLVPIHMNINSGLFLDSDIRLGSRGDSYYEYLLKQYIQTNQTEPVYREMYDAAMQGIHDKLLMKGVKNGLTFTAELHPTGNSNSPQRYSISPKQDHLVCFLGGSLMLGATIVGIHNSSEASRPPTSDQFTSTGKRDWKTGYELVETCYDTHNTATGLSPEIAYFYTVEEAKKPGVELKADWYIKGSRPGYASYDARYILRPETVESIFIAYRLTGDVKYRDMGWKIFRSIEKYCKLEDGGYASILNVDDTETRKDDKMETFFLAETLKYLYLLFSDESVIPLNEYVFNTEAHPLPIFNPNHPLADF